MTAIERGTFRACLESLDVSGSYQRISKAGIGALIRLFTGAGRRHVARLEKLLVEGEDVSKDEIDRLWTAIEACCPAFDHLDV